MSHKARAQYATFLSAASSPPSGVRRESNSETSTPLLTWVEAVCITGLVGTGGKQTSRRWAQLLQQVHQESKHSQSGVFLFYSLT